MNKQPSDFLKNSETKNQDPRNEKSIDEETIQAMSKAFAMPVENKEQSTTAPTTSDDKNDGQNDGQSEKKESSGEDQPSFQLLPSYTT